MEHPSVAPHSLGSGTKENGLADSKSISKRQMVNRINYINFQDQTLLVSFKHSRYDNSVTLRVKPLPCGGERLDCSWVTTHGLHQILKNYYFDYLLIPDGKNLLLVRPNLIDSSEEGISFILPVNCREFKIRKINRHTVTGISAQFTQNSAQFRGNLMDFTPVAMRVEGNEDAPQTFPWINPDIPVDLHLYDGDQLLYSGECMISRYSSNKTTRSFVLRPLNSTIQRFRPKQYRTRRYDLVPAPNIVFKHPLIASTINLKVADVSGSGMAIEENEEDSVLMPGMIIPDLELALAHGFRIACKAQVLSRNIIDKSDGGRETKCGMAILDMDIHEHVKLLSILHQSANKYSYVCSEVDMDALWEFFFETGFIYPEKYAFFQAQKEEIKKTYARLYEKAPQIARHFIYQDRGTILGHMAMVRFYENSWLIHHHAARKTVSLKAGLAVLSQISHYMNELHNLYFAHLQYVYCYFRPENKFPNRVFGGFARQLDDKHVCSLDKFAYFHYHKTTTGKSEVEAPWELVVACPSDFDELESYYRYVSGGLMVDACDMRSDRVNYTDLKREYEKQGFKKEQYNYSLRKEGNLKAMVIVNLTDAGFNMANLTNCAMLILLDENVPRSVVDLTLEQVSGKYDGGEMPVLLYPFSYVEKESYPYEKTYMLWISNLDYFDEYFKYCDNLFKGGGKS